MKMEQHITKVNLRGLFAHDPKRAERFTIEGLALYFDYSKHRISGEIHFGMSRAQTGSRPGAPTAS
jgi:hypothetical protein